MRGDALSASPAHLLSIPMRGDALGRCAGDALDFRGISLQKFATHRRFCPPYLKKSTEIPRPQKAGSRHRDFERISRASPRTAAHLPKILSAPPAHLQHVSASPRIASASPIRAQFQRNSAHLRASPISAHLQRIAAHFRASPSASPDRAHFQRIERISTTTLPLGRPLGGVSTTKGVWRPKGGRVWEGGVERA